MATKRKTKIVPNEAFKAVVAHRTMLSAYIRAIVHDPDLAEDTLQDVSVELVKFWDRYDPKKPFAPWARGVARRVALANLRKHRRNPVLLEGEILEAVGVQMDQQGSQSHLEEQKEQLRRCMSRLPNENQRLIRMRYFENRPYDEIAKTVNRSVEALYTAFSRIHKALQDCVQQALGSA